MRETYLRDNKPGDLIEDVYVLTNKQLAAASNGKPYLKAFVGDRTATLTARMWNCTRETFSALPDGGFVRIRARVENYQNNLQVVIDNVWPAKPNSYQVSDLVAHTSRDIPEMFATLVRLLGTVRNPALAALVDAYLSDETLMGQFRQAPAAQSFHHAYLGGLLEHTLNAVEVANAVCPFYPGLNRDLVVVGIFLHDLAKTWELTYATAFAYSDGGQLIGHIVKAAVWVEEKRKQAEAKTGQPVPQPLVDVIQHIILSHHGELAFGSPKTPATPEAIVVHTLENLDAKLMMALSATRGEAAKGAEGNWTEYLKAFGGRLYRPDVAPAEVEDAPPEEPTPAAVVPPPATKPADRPAKADEPPVKMSITNPLFESLPTNKRR